MQKIKKYLEDITNGNATLSDKQLNMFEKYYEMLVEKNKVMNLTAITDREDVILKHFIDSIALAGFYNFIDNEINVIDVGTGAGFPGIPLKIAFPNINMILYDSLNKRINFLNEVIDEIGLDADTCKAMHGRAEEGGRDKDMREKYDIVLSRAVANMAVLSEYCLPFAKFGGYFIPYKTDKVDEELLQAKKAIYLLGGRVEKIEKIELPDSDIGRSFVFVKKVNKTPKIYPRKAGTANKQPLV